MILDRIKIALGITLFLMTSLLFQYESSFDSFFPGANNILRVEGQLLTEEGQRLRQAATPFLLAETLEKDFEEIESAVRISRPFPKSVLSLSDRQKSAVREGIWADPDFFSVFSIPFIHGQAETALRSPDSLVLSEELAVRMFGGVNPVGRTVIFNNLARCRVTGVFSTHPRNSHFRFPFVIAREAVGERDAGWASATIFTYIRLGGGHKPKVLKSRLSTLLEEKGVQNKELSFTPLTDIHLSGNGYFEFGVNKDRSTYLFFLAIALFLLLLSSQTNRVEYPKTGNRTVDEDQGKPISEAAQSKNGLASRLIQPLLYTLFSTLPAVALTLLLLPPFRRMLGTEFFVVSWPAFVLAVFLALVLVTFSLFIQSIVRKKYVSGRKGTGHFFKRFWKRSLLICTAVSLLVFLLFIRDRIHQLNDERPGFDQNSVLILPIPSSDPEAQNRGSALKTELLRHPHIIKASYSLSTPFGQYASALVSLDSQKRKIPVSVTFADSDQLKTYGLIPRDDRPTASAKEGNGEDWTCVINRSAAALLSSENTGGPSPVTKRVVFNDSNKPLINAVIKDFPFSSRRRGSDPLVMIINPSDSAVYPFLSLRISEEDRTNTMEFIKSRYDLLFPRDVFDYRLLSDDYQILTGPVETRAGFLLLAFITAALFLLLDLESIRQRFIRSGLIHWILYYVGVLLIVRPHFLYHGFGRMLEVPEFSTNTFFIGEKLFQVGGSVTLISNMLAQFFIHPWLGAAIITSTAWGLTRLTATLVKRYTQKKAGILPYFPALMLLSIYNGYDFPLSLSLALMSVLGFSALYMAIRSKSEPLRGILFGLLLIASYLTTGGACLLFAGLALLYEVIKQKNFFTGGIIAAAAALVPYLAGIQMIGLTSRDAFLRLTPLYSLGEGSILIALLLMISPLAAVLGSWLWTRIASLKKGEHAAHEAPTGTETIKQKKYLFRLLSLPSLRLLPVFILALLFTASLLLSSDPTKKLLHTMMYQARKGSWEKVLSAAEHLPQGTYSLYANYMINRALYHEGRLLDRMFEFPQLPEAFVLIASEGERFVTQDITISETTMEMGALNIAEHLNLELMEVAGMHPDYIYNLARINLAQNHFETGRMFLNALSRDWVHGHKARRLLEIMAYDPELRNHPTIRALRDMQLRHDTVNISEEAMLIQLLEINPLNRMAFEFLMARYLLDRNVEKIVENIPRLRELGYGDIPLHIEEAILLYENRFEKRVNLLGKKIRPVTAARFQRFAEGISSPTIQADEKARGAFLKDFGKSYSFYYVFDTSGVQR